MFINTNDLPSVSVRKRMCRPAWFCFVLLKYSLRTISVTGVLKYIDNMRWLNMSNIFCHFPTSIKLTYGEFFWQEKQFFAQISFVLLCFVTFYFFILLSRDLYYAGLKMSHCTLLSIPLNNSISPKISRLRPFLHSHDILIEHAVRETQMWS